MWKHEIHSSSIWSKFTRYANKQENMAHKQEKSQAVEADPEVTKMTLVWKDIETVITSIGNMLQDVKENMNKCEVRDGESQSRYKNYKKEPMEILSWKIQHLK